MVTGGTFASIRNISITAQRLWIHPVYHFYLSFFFLAPCPKPSICPCPCPQRSQGGQATSQRPLPMNGSSPQQCPSVCVCLCLSAVLPQVIPPNPLLPPGPSGNATRPASIVLRPSQTSTSPTPFKQSPGTLVPCSSSGTAATPTISSTPGSTCYSTQQQSTSSITCPPVTSKLSFASFSYGDRVCSHWVNQRKKNLTCSSYILHRKMWVEIWILSHCRHSGQVKRIALTDHERKSSWQLRNVSLS